MRFILTVSLLNLSMATAWAQDLVAKTEARTPAEELKGFKLPPGFEAQLVASEPDIQKPMQIAFDSRGRIFVATSHHYPFAVDTEKASDKVFVLSDFGVDGKAKKVTVFDDKLNIPIGVLPLPDGSVIVSEVGRIMKLTDTDNDGKADKREVLFSGFGTRDTHGMTNSFTLLPDGWVYACHGYLNDSKVKGKDGHEITMNSGHTFRFRPDGSRIEIYTYGQVNPFGMCVDPWLNLYTADCHSRPMTQLIRGARYDSFGKPHDGLGYAPHVINHMHGSTGLCGIVYYAADYFPKEWQGTMFVGNVVTSRINCDRIEWHGSTPVGKERPDFLVSEDPWFRPVDLKLGPDGALYVSDFYNKIVGHYEVDLRHPGRDKDRGRIWRIIRNDNTPKKIINWHEASTDALLEGLGDLNITNQMLAANQLSIKQKIDDFNRAHFADESRGSIRTGMLNIIVESWIRNREREKLNAVLDQWTPDSLNTKDQSISLFAKALETRMEWVGQEEKLLLRQWGIAETGGHRKAVIEAIIAHPRSAFIKTLVEFIPRIPADDTHMKMAARIALRNCIVAAGGVDKVEGPPAVLYDVVIAIRSKESSQFLAKHIGEPGIPAAARVTAAEIIGQFQPEFMATVLQHGGATHEIAQALMNGMLAAGSKRLPEDLTRVVNDEVAKSLSATPPDWAIAAATLRTAAAFSETREALDIRKAMEQMTAASVPVNARASLAESLATVPAAQEKLRAILADTNEPLFLRSRIVGAILAKPTAADRELAKGMLKTAPYAFAVSIAAGLAGDKTGAEMLFTSVKTGEAPARLLQERSVTNKLRGAKIPNYEARVKELTKNLPSVEARLDKLLKDRAAGFRNAKPEVAKGKEIYTKNCAICHQLNNEGAKFAPQLDGVGSRGLERLLEDTIDPNRNVDVALRATKLDLKDGRSLTGLMIRDEAAAYILVDALGKEQRIPKADVEEKTVLAQSAMPANLDTTIPEADYYNLLAFLLEQKTKPAGK